ncbi:MAG TPA: nitrilase-related carbon-nitrogen hydrolase [Syntrophales bacterium]|nr:nitrilase-related carbon-nitrogen hydrolase [Syntrophales bacterium]
MPERNTRLILFILGFGIFMFSRQSELVPAIGCAIIGAPIFILRFIRTQKYHAILMTFLGFFLSLNIALFGLFNLDDGLPTLAINFIRSSFLAVLFAIPYILDKLIYRKITLPGTIKTLVFPVMVTAILFLSSLEGPFDGDVAKDIYAQGPLFFQQTASLFGLWGFVFLFSWVASFVNYVWEHHFQWKTIKTASIVFLCVFLLLSGFGVIKMQTSSRSKPDTVKVASAVLIPPDGKAISMIDTLRNKQTSPFESTINRIEIMSQKAAENAAKIISFQEYAIIVTEDDREMLLGDLLRIAKENHLYLNLSYAYYAKEGKGRNMNLLINPEGTILIDYAKRYLLGIGDLGETGVFKKGPEIIQTARTPYGVLAVSTCRDMSFPPFIRQAGKKNVDVMLGPSYDFPKSVSPSYYLRALENGFSFVRSTYNGISYAIDYNGNLLARMDSEQSKDGMMYADVPIKGVRTFYSRWGDLLGWASIIGALFFIFYASMQKHFVNKSSA